MRRLTAIAALLAFCAPPAHAETLPVSPPVASPTVPVGKPEVAKNYFVLPPEGLVFRLEGPGKLSGFAKAHLASTADGPLTGTLTLAGLPGEPVELIQEFKFSRTGVYGDGRPGAPSRGAKIALAVPAGRHELRVGGEIAGGAELFVIFYYDGPPQWGTVVAEKPAPKKPRKLTEQLGFTWRASSSLRFTYDDNAYKMSEEYKAQYLDRLYWNEEKFQRVDRLDDLILAPGLALEGRRKDLVPLGETRLGFRYSADAYLYNEALFNHEFRVSLRQSMGPGSLELYFNYSPSKYLRQLNDRPPLVSEITPVVSEQFRLERNKVVGIWRQRLHKRVNSSFTLTKKLYYYNKPHIENDIDALAINASFDLTLAKPLRLILQYEYEDAKALAIDVAGQDASTSPASDGTYKMNKINAELRWKWPLKKISSDIRLRAQYAVSYFSAYGDALPTSVAGDSDPPSDPPAFALLAGSFDGNGPIALDTYHTGRVDKVYTYQIKGGRKLPAKLQEWIGWNQSISANYGFGYAERDVDSPWWGDIKEDKNWISRTYWVGFSTRLF